MPSAVQDVKKSLATAIQIIQCPLLANKHPLMALVEVKRVIHALDLLTENAAHNMDGVAQLKIIVEKDVILSSETAKINLLHLTARRPQNTVKARLHIAQTHLLQSVNQPKLLRQLLPPPLQLLAAFVDTIKNLLYLMTIQILQRPLAFVSCSVKRSLNARALLSVVKSATSTASLLLVTLRQT